MTAPRGLFVGLTTVDIVFSLEAFPREDTKNTATKFTSSAGGPASNAAVAFAHLGGVARLASSLGCSGAAGIAKDDLVQFEVDHHDLTPDNTRTPALSAIAVAEDSGSRTIFTSPAIDNDLDESPAGWNWADLVGDVDIVLIDGHQPNVAEAAVRAAKANGVPIVLDGDIYKNGLEKLLPMVDVAIFGKSFARDDATEVTTLFEFFTSHGVHDVVATRGADPIRFVTNAEMGAIDVEPVEAVDTLAAGDFFHGAFCFGLSTGLSLEAALRLAVNVATKSVEQFGTRAWMTCNESDSGGE